MVTRGNVCGIVKICLEPDFPLFSKFPTASEYINALVLKSNITGSPNILRIQWHRESDWNKSFGKISRGKPFYSKSICMKLKVIFHTLCRRSPLPQTTYVVGGCTKGVVELTYEWCHVNLPLLCCNELYTWLTVTPRGRSSQFCCRHIGHGPGLLHFR